MVRTGTRSEVWKYVLLRHPLMIWGQRKFFNDFSPGTPSVRKQLATTFRNVQSFFARGGLVPYTFYGITLFTVYDVNGNLIQILKFQTH